MKTFNLLRVCIFTFSIFFITLIAPSCETGNTAEEDNTEEKKVYVADNKTPVPPENKEERGRYLVTIGGCNDCHTPKKFGPKGMEFDTSNLLSGHPAEMPIPPFDPKKTVPGNWVLFAPSLTAAIGPWGASFSANITPDSLTGIGTWKEENFLKLFQNGKHKGLDEARPILPPMPWTEIAKMKDEDLKAIFAYLRSIKPVNNKVPQPVAPNALTSISKGGKIPSNQAEAKK